jgi:AcrR family transcriptional regulator
MGGTGEATTGGGKRGRPRSAAADTAILTATLELAVEVGIQGMSMDVLAERAGVSKSTVYRRWSSKEELVLDALRSLIAPLDDVDTGAVRDDLRTYLRDLTARLAAGRMSDILPHLIEVAGRDEHLRASLDDYVGTRRRPLLGILGRGIDRGELPADTDAELLADVLVGALFYRRLLTGGPLDEQTVDQVVELVLPI